MSARHHIGSGATYAGSGVSIAAGEAAVDLMKPYTRKTHRAEVIGGIGGFASLFRLPLHRYREPVRVRYSPGTYPQSTEFFFCFYMRVLTWYSQGTRVVLSGYVHDTYFIKNYSLFFFAIVPNPLFFYLFIF